MTLLLFIKGIAIGLGVAIPIGPVGILCIDRTLAHGKASGIATGIGAAIADGVYGAIAAFSVTFVTNHLIPYQHWIRAGGSIILIYLGLKIFREIPKRKHPHSKKRELAADFISTFFLTFTNPMTVISFLTIIAAMGLKNLSRNIISGSALVAGITAGSILWWLIIVFVTNKFEKKMTLAKLKNVNRITGMIVIAFGIIMAISSLAFLTKATIHKFNSRSMERTANMGSPMTF